MPYTSQVVGFIEIDESLDTPFFEGSETEGSETELEFAISKISPCHDQLGTRRNTCVIDADLHRLTGELQRQFDELLERIFAARDRRISRVS